MAKKTTYDKIQKVVDGTWCDLIEAANMTTSCAHWADLEAKADEIDAACIALEVLVLGGKALLEGGA